nr:hypothetical protein [Actinomycetales bacterium]
WLEVSLAVIVILLGVLGWVLAILVRNPPRNTVDAIITDGTFGLYLGWITIATVANTAAVLGAAGFDGFGLDQDLLSGIVLAVAALIGLATAWGSGGRIAPALSLAWGLAWITVGRLDGDGIQSTATAIAAGVASAVVLLGAILIRLRSETRRRQHTEETNARPGRVNGGLPVPGGRQDS